MSQNYLLQIYIYIIILIIKKTLDHGIHLPNMDD
jgi:hypothetical protein